MIEIYVDTEKEKQELLNQSKYIHDFVKIIKYKTKKGKRKEKWVGLDSDKAGGLMHIYMNPEVIIVRSEPEFCLEMTPIEENDHHMTMENFIESCKCGGFTDDDGWGNHATETEVSNIPIFPSDTYDEFYNKSYSHVVWYNK